MDLRNLVLCALFAGSAALLGCSADSASDGGTEEDETGGNRPGGGGGGGGRPGNGDDDASEPDEDASPDEDSTGGTTDDGGTTSPDGGDDGGGTGPGPDTGGRPDTGSDCESLAISLKPDVTQIPNFMLVVDRSNSMNTDDRWGTMVSALREVTTELDGLVNFGLMLFPGSAADGIFGDSCATGDVRVPAGERTSTAISAALGGTPAGGTPTALSLYAARDALAASNPGGRNYVLLATDGGPGCNNAFNASTCECIPGATCGLNSANCLDRDRTLQAVRDLAIAGMPTFIVGIPGTSGVADLLDQMAVEGGTDIGGRHLAVTDAAGLVSTLRTTTGSTVPCTYEFPETPTNVDAIVVTIDGAVIPRDPTGTNGWNVERDRFLEFYGTACSLLRDGNGHSIDAQYDCGD